MPNFLFKFHPINRKGRDFVVGDIHGMFHSLEALLHSISFNGQIDRVFSVGDLIDRGNASPRVVEFLDKPWFYAVMGNHESMLLDSRLSEYSFHHWTKHSGGEWWNTLSETIQDQIYSRISKLPYLFEVDTAIGRVGIAHADIPSSKNWAEIVAEISTDDDLRHYLLWSRNRHEQIRTRNTTHAIEGIQLVVMGHTPHKEALRMENIFYIDTGAVYQNNNNLAKLTLLQIHPKLELHQHSTR